MCRHPGLARHASVPIVHQAKEKEAIEIISLGAVHFLLRAQMVGMVGASPGPSINRGPTTKHCQRPFQRRIVVAPLAGDACGCHAKKRATKKKLFS